MAKFKSLLHLLLFWKYPKKVWIPILLLLIGVGYYYLKPSNTGEEIELATVKRQNIQETISASGTMTGKESALLRFKIGGKIANTEVKIGDTVEKGQLLASLDTTQLAIALQQARNTFTSRQATAERVEDELKDKDTDETFEEKEQRKAAQTARDSSFDSVKEANRAYSDAFLFSPIDGIVVNEVPLIGQNVTAADTIVTVINNSEIYLDAEVDESDIGRVEVGDKAVITLNTYEDRAFSGVVTQILPNTKTTTSGATVVITRIKFEDQNIHFIANTNGQSTIIVKESQNVLTVPQEAVSEDNTVYVKENNEYKKVEVKVGISSDTEIEITEGLSENQEVVTNPTAIPNK